MLLTINYKFLVVGWFAVATPIITYKIYKDYGHNKIIFANYNGYMSPDIISQNSQNIQFESFDNDKKVIDNFKNKIWDVAIVSNSTAEVLLKDELLKTIDWSKLDLKETSNPNLAIKISEKAKQLYSEETQKILNKNDQYLKRGIPYFLSYLSFFYRGAKIDKLDAEKEWSDIIQAIVEDPRFHSTGNKPELAIIDDARTFYSMSQLLHKSNDINRIDESLTKIKSIYNKWSELGFNKQKLGNIFLGSDTMSLINMLSSKEIHGAFFYNGDALYSLQGGEKNNTIPDNDFHTINPKSLIYFLDLLVISKDINPTKEQQLYDFIKKTFFDGINETECANGVFKKESETYTYGAAKNFDHVFYIPTLKKMVECLQNDNTIFSDNNDKYKSLKKKMLLLKDNSSSDATPNPKIVYEGYINPTKTASLNLAYENWKSNY